LRRGLGWRPTALLRQLGKALELVRSEDLPGCLAHPFKADTVEEVLGEVKAVEAQPPRQWDDSIPKELERICLKALSKRASERYTTAREMADDLSHWLRPLHAGRSPAEVGPGPPEPSRPTRVCTTLLDTSRRTVTELVPEAEPFRAEELEAFLAAYAEEAAHATVVVLIGSLPPGTPASFYRDSLALASGRIVLDARGQELLQALSLKPFLVKPNRDELRRTLGRELDEDRELFTAIRELNEAGAEWAVVTDGRKPVYASRRERLYRLQPPEREVVNPIGCGDCMAAGIAWALFNGQLPLDAIRFGLAVAAAKVTQLLPGQLDPVGLDALTRSVEVTQL